MTPDTYPCDGFDACASCDADLVAAERAEGRNPHIPWSLRPLKPLQATGPCTLEHEHDYMCDPSLCTGCDRRGCDGRCMKFDEVKA